jgi:hypothetical protein
MANFIKSVYDWLMRLFWCVARLSSVNMEHDLQQLIPNSVEKGCDKTVVG